MANKDTVTVPEACVRDGARELHELSRTYDTVDGLRVRARCYSLGRAGRLRFEILVDGFGQYAVVDVAEYAALAPRVAEAMDAFAAAARLRGVTAVPVG